MNSQSLKTSFVVVICILGIAQVSCKSIDERGLEEIAPIAIPKEIESVVIGANQVRKSEGDETQIQTTRRPGIILSLWHGLVRAPVEIAKGADAILTGIRRNRVNATGSPPILAPVVAVQL